LFARVIRARSYECERCHGVPATQTAHIIGRGYSATRCVEDNAWNLCGACHVTVDSFADSKMLLVSVTIGEERYGALRAQAVAGIGTWNSKLFWANEVDRLKARCEALGLDTRRRIPT
jgi:hypothetical protein